MFLSGFAPQPTRGDPPGPPVLGCFGAEIKELVGMVVRPSGVVVHDQKLLVMHYQYGGRDRFNLPGGNLEFGEEAAACLKREFAEEMDLEIAVGDLLFCAETMAAERHVLHLIFPAVVVSGTPCLNPTQTRAVQLRWFSHESVENASLYPAIASPLAAWMRKGYTMPIYLGRLEQDWFT